MAEIGHYALHLIFEYFFASLGLELQIDNGRQDGDGLV